MKVLEEIMETVNQSNIDRLIYAYSTILEKLVEKKQQFDCDELNILEQHKEIIIKIGRTKIDCSSEEESDD
jgi:hypothetical protein